MEAVAEEIAEALEPAELLPPGVQQPVNIVDGKPELILPSYQTPFVECAEQCFRELAKTRRFFRQGTVIVELVGSSDGAKLVELTVEAFRSRLETYFTLRSFVILNGYVAPEAEAMFTGQCEGAASHGSRDEISTANPGSC